MSQSWEVKSYTTEEETQARELAARLGLFPAMGYLLVDRGIHTYAEAQRNCMILAFWRICRWQSSDFTELLRSVSIS